MRTRQRRVVHFHPSIRSGGGPAGYLHELRTAIAQSGRSTDAIEVREIPWVPEQESSSGLIGRIANKVRKSRIIGWREAPETVAHAYAAMDFNIQRARNLARAAYPNLRKEHLVVTHEIFFAEALAARDPVWARERLCLMTHSPSFFIRQTVGDFLEHCDTVAGGERLIRHFIDWEEEVMRGVRAVIWPCPEAMEGYVGPWNDSGLGRATHRFCMTGVARPETSRATEALRAEWGVRPGQKVVLFLGRPHPHKGFTVFEGIAGLAANAARDDLVFLWGGRDRRHASDSPARHLGYVTSNADAMRAADLNIVPNTVTYLDLGVLQALSLGAPLLLSNRGGNKAIAACVNGLPTFEPEVTATALDAVDRAIFLFRANHDVRVAAMTAWQRHFSSEALVENHLELIARLIA